VQSLLTHKISESERMFLEPELSLSVQAYVACMFSSIVMASLTTRMPSMLAKHRKQGTFIPSADLKASAKA
jgi:hypothetical protein